MMPRKEKEGHRFGRLVITKAYTHKVGSRWFHNVVCDCGVTKSACGGDMRKGSVTSCGCFRSEAKSTHGMSKEPIYKVWAAMVQRCTNKNDKGYKNYGGRGIRVCDDWLSFDSFIDDMGGINRKGLTLERMDNSGGYNKENCIWANRSAQSINQRLRSDNKTGHKGVSINKDGSYVATMQRNRKRKYLGNFVDLGEAIKARLTEENNFNKLGDSNE